MLINLKKLHEPTVQFYMSELVMAIDSVHHMGFVHRDIKVCVCVCVCVCMRIRA